VTGTLVGKVLFRPTSGILTPDKCQVRVDGREFCDAEQYLLISTTLDRLFLRMNPFWGDGPGAVRLTALASRAPAHAARRAGDPRWATRALAVTRARLCERAHRARRAADQLWLHRRRRAVRARARGRDRAHRGSPHPLPAGIGDGAPGAIRSSPARAQLVASLADELARAVSADAVALAREIAARHGDAVASVVFYGSCLRRGTSEGVHDFYAIVDDYRAAYASRGLAVANALLPPNVFYVELGRGAAPLRAKYAVVSQGDLARACRGETHRAGIWARFAQPVAVAYARDAASRDALARSCADAIGTALRAGLAARAHGWHPADSAVLWREIFRATYAAELRPERLGASDAIYGDSAARFDARLGEALTAALEIGDVERSSGGVVWLRRGLARERGRSSAAKWIGLLQLIKTASRSGTGCPTRSGRSSATPASTSRRASGSGAILGCSAGRSSFARGAVARCVSRSDANPRSGPPGRARRRRARPRAARAPARARRAAPRARRRG
jgi:hypothetical protein